MTSISDADTLAGLAARAGLGPLDCCTFLAGLPQTGSGAAGPLGIVQPVHGYRSGPDAIFLAAAVARGGDLLELGCGAGVAMLAAARRRGDLRLTGVEVQPGYADLARHNAARNGIFATVVTADITALPADITRHRYATVICNPPYFAPGAGKAARDQGRDLARAGGPPLQAWLDAASRRLAPRGQLVLIQNIARLREILACLPMSLGSVAILPMAARAGRAPHRFVLWATKAGRADLRMASPVIVHAGPEHLSDASDYCPMVDDILRNGAQLRMPT